MSAGFYFFIPKVLRRVMVATILLAIFLQPFVGTFANYRAYAASTDIVISEIQTGGSGTGTSSQEFVELKNLGTLALSVQDWKVLYSSSTDVTQHELIKLDGQIPAGGFALLVSPNYPVPEGVLADRQISGAGLAATGGHIKLIDHENIERDRVGWGAAQFAETQSAPAPPGGSSIARQEIDADDNFADFIVGEPTPKGGDLQPLDEPEPTTYLPILITELLPDPASPKLDSQDEFIELYNPNAEPVNLKDYVLQTGGNFQYSYKLPAIEILAGQYIVLYSAETKLTLSNTTSSARLLDPNGEVLHAVDSYNNVGESKTWAFVDQTWQITNQPTPGAANKKSLVGTNNPSESGLEPCPEGKFRNPATNRCKNIETKTGLKPCNPDQFRNPETNRCKKIETAHGLTPCKPGQFRNPATNRCKSSSTTTSSLKPCAPNQFRNPETNRCKKNDSESSLVPCKEGQERNPETNRCRKVAGASTTNPLANPAATATNKTNVSYPAIIAVAGLAVAYGLYEYRQEIKAKVLKIFGKSGK